MDVEMLREYCLGLPGTEEEIKWEDNLCFMIERKIFALYSLNKGSLALKCNPEAFEVLSARDGIQQAPHLARGQWISILDLEIMPLKELQQRIAESRALVMAKLTKKLREKYV